MPILMCPPTHFGVVYEINPWMHVASPVDRRRATDQWEALRTTYRDLGAEVVLADPVLTALVVGGSVTLRFGRTEVAVSGPCTLWVDGVPHLLDPRYADTLAPLLSCLPGSARWVWSGPDGRLNGR